MLNSQLYQPRHDMYTKQVSLAVEQKIDLFVLLWHCHLLQMQWKKNRNRKIVDSDLILLNIKFHYLSVNITFMAKILLQMDNLFNSMNEKNQCIIPTILLFIY